MDVETRSNPIRYRGYFDAEAIYRAIIKWMLDENMDVFEPSHKDKTSGGLREREIQLIGIVKWDEYQKYTMKVTYNIYDSQLVQIEKEGKTITTTQGRFQISLGSKITLDYHKTFANRTGLATYFNWFTQSNPDVKAKSLGFKKNASLIAAIKKVMGEQI